MNRTARLFVLLLASALAPACAAHGPGDPFAGTLVDLSHAYDEQTVFWPTADGFKLEKVAEGVTPRHAQHRLRPVQTLRVAPRPLRAQRPRL